MWFLERTINFYYTGILFLFNCLLVVLLTFFAGGKRLAKIRYSYLLGLLLLFGLRLALPFQIWEWTWEMTAPSALHTFHRIMIEELFVWHRKVYRVWDIVVIIWGAGALVSLIRLFFSYYKVKYHVQRFSKVQEPEVLCVFEKVRADYPHLAKHCFRLVESTNISTLMVFGLHTTYVILPKYSLSIQELKHAFRHELMHVLHGDLYIKLLFSVCRAICWWNPLMPCLQRKMNDLMELRADEDSMKMMDAEEGLDYLQSLVDMAKERKNEQQVGKFYLAYTGARDLTSRNRIEIMLLKDDVAKRDRTIYTAKLCALLTLLFVLQNHVTFTTPTINMDGIENGERFNAYDSGTFYIEKGDGTYELWVQGRYIQDVPVIVTDGIRIYQSLQEAQKHEKGIQINDQ